MKYETLCWWFKWEEAVGNILTVSFEPTIIIAINKMKRFVKGELEQ
jgi:hypothetical protein